MKKIKCFFGHKWTKWKFVKIQKTKTGIKLDVLERECERCNKKDEYVGLASIDIMTGEKSPYIFHD